MSEETEAQRLLRFQEKHAELRRDCEEILRTGGTMWVNHLPIDVRGILDDVDAGDEPDFDIDEDYTGPPPHYELLREAGMSLAEWYEMFPDAEFPEDPELYYLGDAARDKGSEQDGLSFEEGDPPTGNSAPPHPHPTGGPEDAT